MCQSDEDTHDPGLDTEETQTPQLSDDSRSPYLRIFGPDDGCQQVDLSWSQMIIGRGSTAQINLNENTVSRNHAYLFLQDGVYYLEDMGSKSGTYINGHKLEEPHKLKHGDSIQISHYVLQFRTDKSGAKLLPGRFSLLPSSMSIRYRFVYSDPNKIFHPGDTLPVGQGGMLLPLELAAPENVCVEIELTWPDKQKRTFLGEILGMMPGESLLACVKLHQLDMEELYSVVQSSERDNWIVVSNKE